MSRRVGQHHGDLRRALLDAALALVAEAEPSAVTLRAVARRAGVSPGAPYHHFSDKAALLAAVAEEGFRALAQAQESIVGEGAGRLSGLCAAYVRFAMEHPTHYAVMFVGRPEHGSPGLREVAIGTFETLCEAVADTVDKPAPEVRRRAFLIWSMAHGAVGVARWSSDLVVGEPATALAEQVGAAAVAIARD